MSGRFPPRRARVHQLVVRDACLRSALFEESIRRGLAVSAGLGRG